MFKFHKNISIFLETVFLCNWNIIWTVRFPFICFELLSSSFFCVPQYYCALKKTLKKHNPLTIGGPHEQFFDFSYQFINHYLRSSTPLVIMNILSIFIKRTTSLIHVSFVHNTITINIFDP